MKVKDVLVFTFILCFVVSHSTQSAKESETLLFTSVVTILYVVC